MKKTIPILFILFVVLSLYSCSDSGQTYDRAKKMTDKNYPNFNYQLEVSKILKEKDVPYKISQDGALWYNQKDEKIIEVTYDQVKSKHKPDWPNASFRRIKYHNMLLEYLSSENIPYRIMKLDQEGNNYIMWPPEYNSKVEPYKKKLLQEMIKEK